jgi:organic radical activating enzyme
MVEEWQKGDSISKYKLVLSRLKNVDTDFEVDMFGGEPTLHPNIEEILLELKSMPHCKALLISTNLSRSINFYKKFDRLELANMMIAGSYHPEYHNPNFTDKVLALNNVEHIQFSVTVVLSDKPEHWIKTLEFIQLAKANNIQYSLQMLTQTQSYKPNYPTEFFELFQSELDQWMIAMSNKYKDIALDHKYEFADGTAEVLNDFQIYEKNYHRFKGYSCTPLFYEIDTNGDINNLCTSKKIVKIMPKAEDLIKKEVCPKDYCSCETMFNFYKEK